MIIRADARQIPLRDGCVQCVVTSPPYWGLRDYGTARWQGGDPSCEHELVNANRTPWANAVPGPNGQGGKNAPSRNTTKTTGGACGKCGAIRVDRQIGLERHPDEFVAGLVEVFRDVRRAMAADGVLWLNLGDSYATGAGSVGQCPGGGEQGDRWAGRGVHTVEQSGKHAPRIGSMGPMTQPNRMPIEGLKPKDLVGIPWRVAFALQADGWYLRSDVIWSKPNPMPESVTDRPTKAHEYLFLLTKSERYYYDADAIKEPYAESTLLQAATGYNGQDTKDYSGAGAQSPSRAKRNIIESVRRSGNKVRKLGEDRDRPGSHLGASIPWESDGTGRNARSVWTIPTKPYAGAHFATMPEALAERCILAGSRPGDLVLDPFGGSGTTVRVARRFNRRGVMLDLNPAYLALARDRTSGVQVSLLESEATA